MSMVVMAIGQLVFNRLLVNYSTNAVAAYQIGGTGKYADRIEDRFEHASSKLLRIMLEDGDLKARLSSMKSYFLLARGDFLMHFLDIAAPLRTLTRSGSAASPNFFPSAVSTNCKPSIMSFQASSGNSPPFS